MGLIGLVRDLNPTFDRITLTGGEPMAEKGKVLEITRFARSLGIRVRLVTRGWELDKTACRELHLAGVNRVQIGLDSSGAIPYKDDQGNMWDTLHSWLRDEEDGFRRSLAGIGYALEAGLEVSVRYSLCRSNLDDVVPAYTRISRMGALKFKLRALFPDGRAKDHLVSELVSGTDLARAQYDLIRSSTSNHTVVEITQPCHFRLPGRLVMPGAQMPNAYKEPCPCGTAAAYIDSNGDVKYCLFDAESLGNTGETDFLTIWNSDRACSARKQRCPLDQSGKACSSFAILYSRCRPYDAFIREYARCAAAFEHSVP
jgi:MoaA/NifB/PqqE/SkfB family radical SAM enzyme